MEMNLSSKHMFTCLGAIGVCTMALTCTPRKDIVVFPATFDGSAYVAIGKGRVISNNEIQIFKPQTELAVEASAKGDRDTAYARFSYNPVYYGDNWDIQYYPYYLPGIDNCVKGKSGKWTVTAYYHGKVKVAEVHYKRNKLHGPYRFWDDKGFLVEEGIMKNGIRSKRDTVRHYWEPFISPNRVMAESVYHGIRKRVYDWRWLELGTMEEIEYKFSKSEIAALDSGETDLFMLYVVNMYDPFGNQAVRDRKHLWIEYLGDLKNKFPHIYAGRYVIDTVDMNNHVKWDISTRNGPPYIWGVQRRCEDWSCLEKVSFEHEFISRTHIHFWDSPAPGRGQSESRTCEGRHYNIWLYQYVRKDEEGKYVLFEVRFNPDDSITEEEGRSIVDIVPNRIREMRFHDRDSIEWVKIYDLEGKVVHDSRNEQVHSRSFTADNGAISFRIGNEFYSTR